MSSQTNSTASIRSRLVAVAAATSLILAACGSDSDDDATTDDSAEDTAAETTDTSAETEAEETSTTAEAEETSTTVAEAEEEEEATDEDAAPADGVPVELNEWSITLPDEPLTAGTITFALENTGENPHALAIAKGTSYEELPQLDNGAVDTDALGDDFLGRIENIESGESGSGEWELEAGDYVFFCPIQFGPNSHAGAGQVLSVTIG